MQKKFIKIALLLLIISFSWLGLLNISKTLADSPDMIYVPDDYSTIQAAVDAANSGDTIIVRNGTYTENINVNKTHLTIKSENGAEKTIVRVANSDDHVFEVTADYAEINGFTVKGAYGSKIAGIYLYYADHCNISSNNCSNNKEGIRLDQSSENILNNNTISNNSFGITLWESFSNTIASNNVSNNQSAVWPIGILLYYSNNNIITKNITNNNVSNTNPPGGGSGIIVQHSDNNIVIDNTANNNKQCGIKIFAYSINNTVTKNTAINNNTTGISLQYYSSNNIVTKNTLNNNVKGITLCSYSDDNIVVNNTISRNSLAGLWVKDSDSNKIYQNNFIDNFDNVISLETTTNTWNSPEPITYIYNNKNYTNYLGNYWDDYTDIDTGNDGIWDNAYVIDENNQDGYSLVEPFENYVDGEIPPENQSYSIITSPLEIIAKDIYFVGDTLTAKFTVTNRGAKTSIFNVLVVGGRDPTGEVVDFDKTYDVILSPGDSYDYIGNLILPNKQGTYHFFCAYQTPDGNWNTNIDVEIDGKIIEDFCEAKKYRERNVIVFEKTYISPAPALVIWEEIHGPWENKRSNKISQIAVHPNNPEIVYISVKHYHDYWGYEGDEVYKSTNGGESWRPVSEGLAHYSKYYWPVSRIAFAPSHPERVYIATTDPSPYSSVVVSGRGIYLSTNGGSWSAIGGPGEKLLFGYTYYSISSLVIDPVDPIRIYTGTIGNGIWIKKGAKEWEQIWDEPVNKETLLDVNAIAISPANPNAIYAAAYNFDPLNAMGLSGILIPNRIIKSDGDTWKRLHLGILTAVPKIDDITVDERNAEILYIITGVTQNYRIKKSVDGGKTWNDASGTYGPNPLPDVDPILRTIGIHGTTGKMGSVSIHPDNSDVIYVAGKWGFNDVYFSPNSGENWFPLGDLKDKHIKEIVLASSDNSYIIYAVALEGLFKIDLSEGLIEIRLSSPGELRVYDSLGNITGLVDGEIIEEIPNSMYDAENHTVIIFAPSDSYFYKVVGTDEGTYGLTITSVVDGEATTFNATDILTTEGQVHQYTIDWQALAQDEEGVTVQIDKDGDGDFEETFKTDSDFNMALETQIAVTKMIYDETNILNNVTQDVGDNQAPLLLSELKESQVDLEDYTLDGRLNPSQKKKLKMKFKFLETAGNEYQGKNINVNFKFLAKQ